MRSTLSLLVLALGACMPSVAVAQSWNWLGFFGPKSSNQLYAYVDDGYGNPIPGADLELDNGFFAGSNGHTHPPCFYPYVCTTYPPVSSMNPNSGNADASGYMQFTLGTTIVGQEEYIRVCSSLAPDCTLYYLIVGYSDLYLLNEPYIWVLIGARPEHGNSNYYNHWTTAETNNGLYYSTTDYLSNHAQCLICVNDGALEYGGKFDVHGTWASPHIEHDRGSAVDLSTTTSQCDRRYVIHDPNAMVNACLHNGAFRAAYEHGAGVLPHVHCNWQNPATYPTQ